MDARLRFIGSVNAVDGD